MRVASECDASDWLVVIIFANETGTPAYCFDNKSAGERERRRPLMRGGQEDTIALFGEEERRRSTSQVSL